MINRFIKPTFITIILFSLMFGSTRIAYLRPGPMMKIPYTSLGPSPYLFTAGFSGVLGFLMNRLNVSMTAFQWSAKVKYVPSWQEMAVSASFVVVSFIIFAYGVKYFGLFHEEDLEPTDSIEESAVKAV